MSKESKLTQRHFVDGDGNPAGGHICALGMEISFQDGPVKKLEADQAKTASEIIKAQNDGRNGAFVEDVIEAAIGRLTFFQGTKFACVENRSALVFLKKAKSALTNRTARRVKQGVEGKYEKHVSTDA